MRVPLSWLQDFVDVTLSVDDLAHRLTMAGLEVGDVEYIGADWQPDKLFVGEVVEVAPHPNADRLVLATVAYGADAPANRGHWGAESAAWRSRSKSGVRHRRGGIDRRL